MFTLYIPIHYLLIIIRESLCMYILYLHYPLTLVCTDFAIERDNAFKTDHILVTLYEPRNEISNNVVCAASEGSDQPAHTRSMIRAFACRLNILRLLSY